MGHNLGRNHYKLGFICLIGIAHLTETLTTLKFNKIFELRPTLNTDLNPQVEEELSHPFVPAQAKAIAKNLFCAIRTVAAHVVHRIPICGNIIYQPDKEPSPIRHEIYINEEESETLVDEELKQDTFDFTHKLGNHQRGVGKDHKKSSIVSFSSQLNIQHNGGIHDTVILDDLIDRSAIEHTRGGLFHDTSQVLMEETLINEFDKGGESSPPLQ